jgi:hypothetical protein
MGCMIYRVPAQRLASSRVRRVAVRQIMTPNLVTLPTSPPVTRFLNDMGQALGSFPRALADLARPAAVGALAQQGGKGVGYRQTGPTPLPEPAAPRWHGDGRKDLRRRLDLLAGHRRWLHRPVGGLGAEVMRKHGR